MVEQTKMAGHLSTFRCCIQCALMFLFLASAHVQAREMSTHTDGHSFYHGSIISRQRTLLSGQFQFRGAAAGSIKTEAVSNAKAHGLPRQVPSAQGREESDALLYFKAGIYNVISYDGISYPSHMPILQSWDAKDSTPCGWAGVTCSPSTERVVGLDLHSHGLAGTISFSLRALGKLQSLQRLDLSNNSFQSFILGDALANFSRLEFLNLSHNQIVGDIPPQIGDLANLQSLVLNRNNLSGQIPPSICNCTLLTVLNLQSNQLTGDIPRAIGRLTFLQDLVLGNDADLDSFGAAPSGNDLSGSIPPSLGNCSFLSVLNLNFSRALGGQIPQEFSQLQRLRKLSLDSCNIQGVLPRWIGNLTYLTEIHLGKNQFHGPIPAGFGRLSNLSWLALSGNSLTGDIPAVIANCTSLTAFAISSNLITGIIPPSLGNCTTLQFLSLGPNPLMGPEVMPSWISSLTQLRVLELPGMNLRSDISKELGRLRNLRFLSLTENALTGSIPPSLSNCTFLHDLSLTSNNLTGHIPSEIGLLARLSTINLGGNFLIGSIPISLLNLTSISAISLRGGLLSGDIDVQWEWGRLPFLNVFDVADNRFLGSLPTTLSNCSKLSTVDFSDNDLGGVIPASFGNLSVLNVLDASNNRISGELPVELARCSLLGQLRLSGNKLQGVLPLEFGNLPLTHLDLSHNELSGTKVVTDTLGSANPMEIVLLDLSYNRFSGSVFDFFFAFNLVTLTSLNISHNFLSGSVPAEWNTLTGIQEIDISANNISGSLPNLDGLTSLRRLDVSFNNLSGEIPQSLASLPNLDFFNASYNDFEGPVPSFAAFKSNITAASFFENPELCGDILGPSRKCRNKTSQSSGSCAHFQCARLWVPVVTAGATTGILFAAAVVIWSMITRARARAKGASMKQENSFDYFVNFSRELHNFAPTDILAAIKGEENVIGIGAGSVVYKGTLPGCGMVAIKYFARDCNDFRELDLWQELLEQEARIQSKLRHRNVLKVLSFCCNPEFRALLLQYMPQGSLADHLYPWEEGCELPWNVRFGIAVDVVEGMTYLHHDCPEPLIHGDLKPSNILLDDEMVAKVADFGISKLVNLRRKREPGEATVSRICGTIGYMPPEYAFVSTVSTKGDVYSYGVLLLEMLSARSPRDVSPELDYRAWNIKRFEESPMDLLDPILQQEGRADALKCKQMMLLARVALFCTRKSPRTRPSMKDVRVMLSQIKELGIGKAIRRTVSELLAHEIDENVRENEDPNDVILPSV